MGGEEKPNRGESGNCVGTHGERAKQKDATWMAQSALAAFIMTGEPQNYKTLTGTTPNTTQKAPTSHQQERLTMNGYSTMTTALIHWLVTHGHTSTATPSPSQATSSNLTPSTPMSFVQVHASTTQKINNTPPTQASTMNISSFKSLKLEISEILLLLRLSCFKFSIFLFPAFHSQTFLCELFICLFVYQWDLDRSIIFQHTKRSIISLLSCHPYHHIIKVYFVMSVVHVCKLEMQYPPQVMVIGRAHV